MQIYAYIASACMQSVPTTMKTLNSRRCLLLEQQHSHIYIFVQMFVLDKAYPNLIVGIDALDRLQH